MRTYFADFHIHTALSPCAEREMTPRAIVEEAARKGLSLIAICDHNSAGNVAAVQESATQEITVIAGMEITTTEEVHVLGLFPNVDSAQAAGGEFYSNLPTAGSTSRIAGDQTLFDIQGQATDNETRLLSAHSGLDLVAAIALIKRHQGLAVAAHADRPSFGVIGQLGLFPDGAGFDAIEVTPHLSRSPWRDQILKLPLPMITSSDAHFLADIGQGRTKLSLAQPSFEDLLLALQGSKGRTCSRA